MIQHKQNRKLPVCFKRRIGHVQTQISFIPCPSSVISLADRAVRLPAELQWQHCTLPQPLGMTSGHSASLHSGLATPPPEQASLRQYTAGTRRPPDEQMRWGEEEQRSQCPTFLSEKQNRETTELAVLVKFKASEMTI